MCSVPIVKLVYISGPYRGASAWQVEQNIRCAEDVGFKVACLGGTPAIPHTMYRYWHGTQTDQFWLAATMDLLRACAGVVLLEGWRRSAGAAAEKKEAEKLGLLVWHEKAVRHRTSAEGAAFRRWLRGTQIVDSDETLC